MSPETGTVHEREVYDIKLQWHERQLFWLPTVRREAHLPAAAFADSLQLVAA